MNALVEIGIILVTAAIAGTTAYFCKQPLVLAYIIGGIMIGPYGLGLINDTEFIHGISEMGIMLMLFLVGIEMSLGKIKELGILAIIIGLAQILFTGLCGFAVAFGFGFGIIPSIYIGFCLTLSSTVVVVKALSDQKTLNSLYGKIVVGILIVQDFIAILTLVLLKSVQASTQGHLAFDFAILLVKGGVLALISIIGLRRLLTWLYYHIAHSGELLVLASLSWCFIVALTSEYIGFSREMGAFIAGLSLADLPYAIEISNKTKIVRDFFITIFFVSLGAGMMFATINHMIWPLLALSLFVIIGNPLIVIIIMRLLGLDKRSSFLAGMSIAQISEFSLILITMGAQLGHVSTTVVSMISMITILTISVSAYITNYNQQLYTFCKPFLKWLPSLRQQQHYEEHIEEKLFDHIVLLGCGHSGQQLLDSLALTGKKFIIVDHDPQVIAELSKKGVQCIFGDVHDEELFHMLNIAAADMVISLLPKPTDNYPVLEFLANLKQEHKPMYVVTTDSGQDGFNLFHKGADYVIVKSALEAEHIQHVQQDIYPQSLVTHNSDGPKTHTLHSRLPDKEYAQIVHKLSKIRLTELKNNNRFSGVKN